MKTAIVPGSLSAIAKDNKTSIAESFVNCDAVVLVDVSGSMNARDSLDGQRRYDVALQELEKLQANQPGKLAILAFSRTVEFCPGGVPPFMGLSTKLAGALRFAKMADVPEMKFFIISDGMPDNEQDALAVAGTIKAPIYCIYVGPEGGSGQKFLEKLAKANSGKFATADRAMELASVTERLLLGA